MAKYIQFCTSNGDTILVEVEAEEVRLQQGVVKAGLKEKAKDAAEKAVDIAQSTFEEAMERVIRCNAHALIDAVRNIPERPSEIEMSFGLKATGELGNVAVCKVSEEANYAIKLVWKQMANEK